MKDFLPNRDFKDTLTLVALLREVASNFPVIVVHTSARDKGRFERIERQLKDVHIGQGKH